MFPRPVLIIVAVLLIAIAGAFVYAELVVREGRCVVDCNRGIAYPYQELLAHMRQLAESGNTDELRALIIRAQERSNELSQACGDHKEDDGIYARQVRELIR